MTQKTAGPVRRRRIEKGLTLQGLAEKCAAEGVRVHNSQLSRIERGLAAGHPRLRATLARILNLDVDDFEPRTTRHAEKADAA
ncbi:MAG: helix-turn-helix transcriptional regulator [Streptomyces sp.]|nr:helix-turn-helix transcriptional regulator [Streptomyces sp.]